MGKRWDKCQYKNCREPYDVILDGKPLCTRHYQVEIEERRKIWVRDHPGFYIDGAGSIKKHPETPSQTPSPSILKKDQPSLDDFI